MGGVAECEMCSVKPTRRVSLEKNVVEINGVLWYLGRQNRRQAFVDPFPEMLEVGKDVGYGCRWEKAMVWRDIDCRGRSRVRREPGGHEAVMVTSTGYEISAMIGDNQRMFPFF